MWLKSISCAGFRNLAEQTLEFDVQANHFFGNNGSGKTSLLEAIHFLAIGRSFRRAQDRDLLKFETEVLSVQGEALSSDDGAASMSTRVATIRSDGMEKRLKLDGVDVDRLSSYLGWLPVVTMLLDDIRLIRGGPGERRGFIDLALSKMSRDYLLSLTEYRRVLSHLNRVLIQRPDPSHLQAWESQLVVTGAAVYEIRNQFLAGLFRNATEVSSSLLGGPGLTFSYRSTVDPGTDVKVNFTRVLEQTRGRAIELGAVLAGPHRDDIIIQKGGVELRRFGSEGEQRCASIALKLAEAKLLHQQKREKPVFLLDEVASELDLVRSAELLAILAAEGQIFYAAAKPIPAGGRIFSVDAGKIQAA